jgi:hypothetical protein
MSPKLLELSLSGFTWLKHSKHIRINGRKDNNPVRDLLKALAQRSTGDKFMPDLAQIRALMDCIIENKFRVRFLENDPKIIQIDRKSSEIFNFSSNIRFQNA